MFRFCSILICAFFVYLFLKDTSINGENVIRKWNKRSINRLGMTAIKLSRLLRLGQATRILIAQAKEIERTTDAKGKPIIYLSKVGGMEKARTDFWRMVGTDFKVRHSYGDNWEMYTARQGNTVVEFLKSGVNDSPSRIKLYSKEFGSYIVDYE